MPSISLPTGGGAIRGIGEKFSVNAQSGNGVLTIPIFTSPGRSNISPQLSLSYSPGNGNGPLGLGWRSSIPSVCRKTEKGLPRYDDDGEADTFILSESEDLVPALSAQENQWGAIPAPDITLSGQTYSITRYRPRVEGIFARVERWRRQSDGISHWRVVTKDNVTSIYGRDSNCVIADPRDPSRIFKWLLEATFDDKGNVVFYEYKPEDSSGVDGSAANERNRQNQIAPYTNLYIKRILYGAQSAYQPGEDLSKRTDWLFEAVFDYGEHDPATPVPAEDPARKWNTRADPFSTFRSTFDIRTYRLCKRVLMFHHFPRGKNGEAGYDGLVRSTDFTYDQADPSSSLSGNPIATKLISLTQTGYNWDSTGNSYISKSLPPLGFTYSEAAIDTTVRTVDPASLANLPSGLDGTNYQWLDLDGEGISGILTFQTGGLYYKRNRSPVNVTLDGPEQVDVPQTSASFGDLELLVSQPSHCLAAAKPQFLDLAGDGRQNLVHLDSVPRGYYNRAGIAGRDGTWDEFQPFLVFPNVETTDRNLRFVDVDGDGLTDLLVSEDEVFAWYRSYGRAGFGSRQYARKPFDEERGAALVFAEGDESIFLADMTGDGLTDIVRIRNGEVCYWANLGYGRFGAKVTMDNAPYFDKDETFDPRRIRLADIDGCGTTDIIYLAARGVAIYHNQSGNSWSAETTLDSFPALNDVSVVNAVDLLGNGTTCLVWSSPLAGDAGRQMRYIDLMGNQKPHLLMGINNNLGAETRIRFASSSKFYVEDREAGTPWVTKLPFPVPVAERVEVFDYIGRTRLVNTYRYRHGYFDGEEREFRGFGYVEQTDADSFGDSGSLFTADTDTEADALHAPPVVTKTWFHTGAWPDESTVLRFMARDYFGAPAPSDPQFAQKWSAFLSSLPADSSLPGDVLQTSGVRVPYALLGGEQREALRALRGKILRQEIYSSDRSAHAGIPYTVSARNYTIECLQPRAANPYAVFLAHDRETIDFNYERNVSDPRVAHRVVLAADPFGDVLESVSIAYGRNLAASGLPPAPPIAAGSTPDVTVDASGFVQLEQLTGLLTLEANSYTQAIDTAAAYRNPMTAESILYQLTRPARADESVVYQFSDLTAMVNAAIQIPYETAPDPTKTQKRVIRDTRTLYYKNDLSGPAPLGQTESLGLVFQTHQLALTASLAQQIFVNGNTNPNKPAAADLDAILSGSGTTVAGGYSNSDGGFVNSQGDSDWWNPSVQALYSPVPQNPPNLPVQSAAFAAANFYLPQAHRDAFGQYVRLTYDSYNLLLAQTQDAVGSVVAATNDYRVLQCTETVDANQNHSQVAFDALGMVAGTAVKGKLTAGGSESGDSLATLVTDLAQADIDGFINSANPLPLAPGLLGTATVRRVYDLTRFLTSQAANPADPTQWKPNFVATISRENHVAALPGQQNAVQVSFSYSDGLGREIQKKAQAEPGPLDLSAENAPSVNPRWIGSGWRILNNKAKPVRQYEPFFSSTRDFEFAIKTGVTRTMFYDPLERVVATLYPDATWGKTVFEAWRQRTWDANDTVQFSPKTDSDVGQLFSLLPDADYLPTWYQLRTDAALSAAAFPDPGVRALQSASASKAAAHNDTPSTALFDVLGRQSVAVEHNRLNVNGVATDQYYATRTGLDIQGNQLSVTDAMGRQAMSNDYDQTKQKIHSKSMDACERWMFCNVAGKQIRAWDSRGFLVATSYDELHRPIGLNATGNGLNNILAEKTIYGDSKQGGPASPELTNSRGRIYQVFDAAGLVTNFGVNPVSNQNEAFDFQGNLIRSRRQLLADYKNPADWTQNPALGTETFTTATRFDCLNRVTQQIAPYSDGAGAKLNIAQPTYNEANLLQATDIWLQQGAEPGGLLASAGASFHSVVNIDYDEKGRRTVIDYGNGASTTYQYDPDTFRLTHLLTSRKSDGVALQDLVYYFDPTGNLTHIQDNSDIQNVVYFANRRVDPSADYTYDAVYRLISATGREHLGMTGKVPNAPTPESYNDWLNVNLPHPNDGNAMGVYTENYAYDTAGNPLAIQHVGSTPANPGWTRSYRYAEASLNEPARFNNRLSGTTVGSAAESYTYDVHGSTLRMPHLQAMQWDFKNQLQMTQRQAVNNQDQDGTKHQGERTYYVYDTSGQRVVKATESSTGALVKQRIYLGSFELYREYGNAGVVTLERQTLHVMDDKRRIALVEMRTQGQDGTPAQLIRLQFSNHLDSACLELDDQAQVITYEEYYPYGGAAYEAVTQTITPAAKRYRYTGKERDEETGFGYHGARYYAAWLARWISADPAGLVDGPNLYRYARCSPTILTDPGGTDPPAAGDAKKVQAAKDDDEDDQPEPQQAQPEDSNFSSAAATPPAGTWTSEFGLSGFGGGTSAGGSGGGAFFYHFRAVTSPGTEWGLMTGFGGTGPPSVGTGQLNLTLHLGAEPKAEGLQYLQQSLTGWYFAGGFVWGQNPLVKPYSFSDSPQEAGGANVAGSVQFAYSSIVSRQKKQSLNLKPVREFDFNFGLAAQRFGAINGVGVTGLLAPSVIFNWSWNDKPGEDWQVNFESATTVNLGLGGVAPGQYQPPLGPGTRGVPFSVTETLGIGFQHAWGDYAFTIEPYAQHEAFPNVWTSDFPSGVDKGAWGGGIKFGLTAINRPKN